MISPLKFREKLPKKRIILLIRKKNLNKNRTNKILPLQLLLKLMNLKFLLLKSIRNLFNKRLLQSLNQ